MQSKMQLLKQALLVSTLMIVAITLFSAMPLASAALIDQGDNIPSVSDATGGATDLKALVLQIVDYFLLFLGLIAVIMVIYGGVTYVTSAGNDEAIGNAKKIIMYALIGIVVILLSFVVVNAVLKAGTGT